MSEVGGDERAERILDAAAELLLRHGYGRVTIEDVARLAEVGKGTVYLHWRTREELFTGVLIREVAAAFDEVADVLETDPRAWRLHATTRAFFLSIMQRPLLLALVRSDPEVLGRLTGLRLQESYERRVAVVNGYFGALVDHGLLRDDLSIEDLALAYRAVTEGFIVMDVIERSRGSRHDPRRHDLEHVADVLAAIVRAAFESGADVPDEVQMSLRRSFAEQLRTVAAADRAGARKARDPDGPARATSSPDRSR